MKITKKIQAILDVFQEISAIPRNSKNEEKISQWVMDWADDAGFSTYRDRAGNLIIRVPASPGFESSETVIIQGHLDMVCEKSQSSLHDFESDPIKLIIDGEWIRADNTSLGADNGIAIAMAMLAATDNKVKHPPMELLFTVDEETGLTGASGLEPDILKGRKLLNIDSEDEGVFTIGCAGGRDSHVTLPLNYEEAPWNFRPVKIFADGFTGGHSGVNIHEGRANAIKIVTRALHRLRRGMALRVSYISGGTAHNAIPRFCHAIAYLPEDMLERGKETITHFETTVKAEYALTDPNLSITIEEMHDLPDRRAGNEASTDKILNLLLAFPHGVARMSQKVSRIVETSSNLANVTIDQGTLKIISSQRSSIMSQLTAISDQIGATAELGGADCFSNNGYPSWEPNMDSELLKIFQAVYKKAFRKNPIVETIHAGLECGLIGRKYPGMDMISFGVTICDPHSTQERMHIESIGKVWDLLVKVLAELCN